MFVFSLHTDLIVGRRFAAVDQVRQCSIDSIFKCQHAFSGYVWHMLSCILIERNFSKVVSCELFVSVVIQTLSVSMRPAISRIWQPTSVTDSFLRTVGSMATTSRAWRSAVRLSVEWSWTPTETGLSETQQGRSAAHSCQLQTTDNLFQNNWRHTIGNNYQ